MSMFAAALLALAALLQPAQTRPLVIQYGDNVVTLDAVAWAKLPREKVTGSDHGTQTTFEGVLMRRALSLAKVPSGSTLRGEALRLIVRVEAADGYQAVFALAEIDPQFRERSIIIADMRDGKPLGTDAGPFQVVVPDEARGARWVRQVTRIVVFPAGGAP